MHNTHERDIGKLGGLARQIPIITVIFTIAGLGAMGVPGTSGFISEFMVFLGSFGSTVLHARVLTVIAILGILMGAGYILWLLQRVFYGPPQDKFNSVEDANKLEVFYSTLFIIVIFAIGLDPSILTNIIKTGVAAIIH
jgi:NADH-quinone oxidoreductase subunit M